jgi:NitT/TauT family transport system substrate-binding protein
VGISVFGNAQGVEALEKVSVMMPFFEGLEWSGFYAAIINSHYADAGIEADMFYTPEGGSGAVGYVGAGRAMFGYATAEAILFGRAGGLPVVAVYQPERNNLFSLIVRENSGIEDPSQLAGKTIAVSGIGSPVHIAAMAILNACGVDLSTVDFIPLVQLVPALELGHADAIGGYIIMEELFKMREVPIKVWYAKDYVGDYGGTSLFTTEEVIQNRPELVRSFVEATHQGYLDAIADISGVVEYVLAEYPDVSSFIEAELALWERLVEDVYIGNEPGLGQIDPERWDLTYKVLLGLGLVPEGLDVTEAYSLWFLPKE